MEERKLIKQGIGGLTIYLPKKWLSDKGLKEGDKIKIEEVDNSLIINGETKGSGEIIIDIDDDNSGHLRHLLTHTYRRGFNKIVLKLSKNYDVLKIIKKVVNNVLLGFEITSINDKEIIIENISEPTEQKYDVMIQKVFLVLEESHELVRSGLEKDISKNFDEMQELRDQSDKFIIFCKRLLTKNKNDKNSMLEWEFLSFIIDIQHTYYYLYHYLTENKVIINKEIKRLMLELGEYLKNLKSAYIKKDAALVHKINAMKKKYQFGEMIKHLEKSKGKETVIYAYIKEIFRLIQLSTSSIMSMSLGY